MATVTKQKIVSKKAEPVQEASLISFTDDEKLRYVRVLSVGRAKTGKTFLAGTFPKPFVINTDKGLATLRDKNIPFVTIHRMTKENKRDDGAPKGWLDVRKIILSLMNKEGEVWEALQKAKYVPETLILDSISTLSDLMEAEIVADPPDRKDREDTLFLGDYNIIQRRLLGILDLCRELPMHFVATAGIDINQDELQRIIENPQATGNKLGPKIPHYFDDVYLHSFDKDKGKWLVSCAQTKRFPHSGTRYQIPLTDIENPTFEKVRKHYGL